MVDLTSTSRLRMILIFSGIYFDCQKNPILRRLHQLLAFFILSFCSYITLFIVYDIVRNHKTDPRYASYTIVFFWQLQSIISIIFFIYWQSTGTIQKMGSLIEHTTKSGIRAVRKTILISILMMVGCVSLTFGVTIMIHLTGREHTFFNIQAVNPFFLPPLACLNLVGGTYLLLIFIVIMCFLSSQSLLVHAELKQLNNSLARIGNNATEPNAELLVEELRSHLNWHLIIAERIRIISGFFEKYGFLMFATNLPLFIFTLYTLIVRMNIALIDAILTIPEVILGLMKVVFLLYIPSKIQTEAKQTYSILCANQAVWTNLDQRVFEMANVLLLHAGQHDLGIFICCMTVISKPFILTGSSVVITSLMYLVQSHYHCKPSNNTNELVPVDFNITGPII